MTQVASTAVLVPDTITSRRSIRDFTAEAITDDQVHALLHAAVLAPTAMHQEPWQFVVVQDREALRRPHERRDLRRDDRPADLVRPGRPR